MLMPSQDSCMLSMRMRIVFELAKQYPPHRQPEENFSAACSSVNRMTTLRPGGK